MTSPLPTFDHSYIENTQLIDRYVLGKLDAKEAEWFDDHFPDCGECLEALELSEAFLEAMRRQRSAENRELPPKAKHTLARTGLALAAGLVIGLLIPKLIRRPASFPPIQETSNQVLLSERSTPSEPTPLVFLPGSQLATFTFPTGEIGDRYRLTFLDENRQTPIQFTTGQARDVQMSVSLNRAYFEPGRYKLDIETLGPNGQTNLFAQHLLQVVHLAE